MAKEKRSLEKAFYGGQHRRVVEQGLDSVDASFTAADLPWILGALVYLGRLEEASSLYELERSKLTLEQTIVARYFLGVGYCRHSHYSKSRAYFAEIVRDRKRASDPRSRFFIFQGLGFYRFFSGQLRRAVKYADRAFSAALEDKYLYGRALAADLKGHSIVQTGQVREGMRLLELAVELSTKLGATWLKDAISTALIVYRSLFGLSPDLIIEQLQKRLASLSDEDIYSRSNLLLALAQEQMRRGRLNLAKDALNECCRIVYGSKNRRHAAILNLRYAAVHEREGDLHLALNLTKNALTQIDPEVDLLIETRLRGMERKLLGSRHLDTPPSVSLETLDRELKERTTRVGEIIGHRMVLRQSVPDVPSHLYGEDPAGDLRDFMVRNPESSVSSILQTGYHGYLSEVLPIRPGDTVLYLDLTPGSLTLFDRGSVTHLPEALSRSHRRLLLALSQGSRTKQRLISDIWGYEYHPLRHDPLIYSAVAKLRRLLAEHSFWIEIQDSGYALKPGVRVLQSRLLAAEQVDVGRADEAPLVESSLNVRQRKVLGYLEENEYIDKTTYGSLFQTSEVTATRDLSELVRLRLLTRVGKARATKYTKRGGTNV